MALHLYLNGILWDGVWPKDQPWWLFAGAAACAVLGAAALEAGAGAAGCAAGCGCAACCFCASHCSNSALGTAFTTIGMKPWSWPHSSAHWPRYTPGSLMLVQAALTIPGMASIFQPSAGTHQEWITSPAVITKRILVPTGTTSGSSTLMR